ncbi:MAG: DMT family transporter [Alphaproteobacteria bacterium]|nr:DMT family transporter [Alphaproteobacteria bacterium]
MRRSDNRKYALSAPRRWTRIAPNVRGATWILSSALIFTAMTALIKVVGTTIDAIEIAFFRSAFGVAVLLPFVHFMGWKTVLRPKRLDLQIIRGLTGSLALITIIYALTRIPLASVTGISFSRILWLILLAVIFLKEKPSWQRGTATAIGFVGVWIIVDPSTKLDLGTAAALVNAVIVAINIVLTKRMTLEDESLTILFWGMAISTIVVSLPTVFIWRTPDIYEMSLLAVIGIGLSAGHACLIHGLRVGDATAVMPFDYSRLLFAGLAGVLFFDEIPSIQTVSGAILIVAATFYIAHQEAAKAGAPNGSST